MRLFSGRCTSTARLDGKTAVITGANTGIGKCTAKDFYERGAKVILACRDLDKGQEAIEDIKQLSGEKQNLGELSLMRLDLASLSSVRTFAEKFLEVEKRLDLLINNAGVMMCPEMRTEDGFEMQFGTNHLGHFLLTLLLLPRICQSKPARIVNVSSRAHAMASTIDFTDLNWQKRTYSALGAYQQSKLANVLFSKELARKLNQNNITGVTTYSLHPGVIRTELGRHMNQNFLQQSLRWMFHNVFGYFIKTPEQGAQTQIYCAVDEKCANDTGLYYSECSVACPSKLAENEESASTLWSKSLELVGLGPDYNPFQSIFLYRG